MGRIKRVAPRPLGKQLTKQPLSRALHVKMKAQQMPGDHRSLAPLGQAERRLMPGVQLPREVRRPATTTKEVDRAVECQGKALMKAAGLLLDQPS